MKLAEEEFSKNAAIKVDEDNKSINSDDYISTINEEKLVFEQSNVVLQISGNPEKFCQITKCTKSVLKYFGYSCEEIVGANIAILMPKFMKEKHSKYVKRYTITGKKNIIGKQKLVFILNKFDHIIPMWLMVKETTNISGEIEFIGMLKMLKSKQFKFNYILLNKIGEIEGMTSGFHEKIFEQNKHCQSEKINILLFAPKLLRKMFKMDFKNLKSEKIEISLLENSSKEKPLAVEDHPIPFVRRKDRKPTKISSQASISKLKSVITTVKMNLNSKQLLKNVVHSDESSSDEEINQEGVKKSKFNFQMRIPEDMIKYIQQLKEFIQDKDLKSEKDLMSPTLDESSSKSSNKRKGFSLQGFAKFLLELNTTIHRTGKYTIYNVKAILKPYSPSYKEKEKLSILKIISMKKTNDKFQSFVRNNAQIVHQSSRDAILTSATGIVRRAPLLAVAPEKVFEHQRSSSNVFSKSLEDFGSGTFSTDGLKVENEVFMENTDNIFIKEENLHAKIQLSAISQLKWYLRFVFFTIFLLNLITYFIGVNQQLQQTHEIIDKQVISLQLQLNMLKFEENIINLFLINDQKLNVSDANAYSSNINGTLTKINNFLFITVDDVLASKVILDNPSSQTVPYSTNSGIIQTGIPQLFSLVKSSLSLTFSNYMRYGAVNNDIVGFRDLYGYNVPLVVNFLYNQTEFYPSLLLSNINRTFQIENIAYAVQAGITFWSFVFFIHFFFKVIATFRTILEIFTDISRNSVEYMKYYFILLYNNFVSMQEWEIIGLKSEFSKFFRYEYKKIFFKGEEDDINLKKGKVVEPGNLLFSFKRRMLLNYIIILFFTILVSGSYHLFSYMNIVKFKKLLTFGEQVFKLAPATNVAILEYKLLLFNETDYRQKFSTSQSMLSNFFTIMKNSNQISSDVSEYSSVSLFQKYYFDNGCNFPSNITLSKCQSWLSGVLNKGFVSLVSYVSIRFEDHLMLSTDFKFGNITNDDILQLSEANDFYLSFLNEFILEWNQNCYDEINLMTTSFLLILIFIQIGTVALYIMSEFKVVSKNQEMYNHYRRIYENFMPNLVISKERISRAKLVLAGILNK